MAQWTYSDWITQTNQATRLTRLRLHIQEVSEKTLGSKTRTGAYFPVSDEYLKSLKDDEKTLAKQVEASTVPSFARSLTRCRRA